MSETEIPQLDAPGAGLPLVQEFILKRIAFPILRRLVSWERALTVFEREGRLILDQVRAFPPSERARRVLVPRMMGIEDSSRYWSLEMALDHLVIVSRGVLGCIVTLSRGGAIDVVVDTAAVKPDVNPSKSIEQEFEQLLEQSSEYLKRNVADRRARNCHVHPWFGCLNPHAWLVMLAIHQYIHRRQVVEIGKQLSR